MSFYAELDKEPRDVPFPIKSPWSGEGLSWTQSTPQSGVMRFEAVDKRPSLSKRKHDIVPPIPTKQFITEEKMIAHFSGLHISDFDKRDCDVDEFGEWNASGSSTSSGNYTIPMSAKELEQKLKNATKITVCEQLKKFDGTDTFIRKLLRDRKEQPCTALVIWQPPPKLKDLITGVHEPSALAQDDGAETDEEDNNNSSIVDYNSNNNIIEDAMDTDL